MADAATICNLALSHLGDTATVVSIDPPEESAQAKMCAIFYPQAVNTLLDLHDWSFATRRAVLPELVVKERFGWAHVFEIPADCLHTISVTDSVRHDEARIPPGASMPIPDRPTDKREYRIEGRRLYTNLEAPVLSYVSSEVSPGEFSPSFILALSYYLANLIAGARIKSKEGIQIASGMQDMCARALSVAKTRDSAQRQDRIEFIPNWIQVR